MRVRRKHLAVLVCAVWSLALVVLVSGCVLTIGDAGPATLAPPSSPATPAPAGLFVDPPAPAAIPAGVSPAPALQEPAVRIPFADPVSGTRLVRITDCQADVSKGDASEGIENENAGVQAFNAGGSRLVLRGTEGSWYLYNATTLLPEGRLPFNDAAEPRWDAALPDVLYYVDGPRFMRYGIAEQESTVVRDFSSQFQPHAPANVWSRGKGGPSQDGRYWGLMAQGGMGKTFAFMIYDPYADQIVARRDLVPTYGVEGVTISPLGDYFLAYCQPRPAGQPGTDSDPAGLMVYDRDLKNGRCILPEVGRSDLALDAQGREVIVYEDSVNGTLALCELATGRSTVLLPINTSIEISGRATGVPGWALVSSSDRIFAVELRQGGRVVALARPQAPAAPRVTADRNFTRVLFASSWGRPDPAAVETYMIVLPQGWTGLPA